MIDWTPLIVFMLTVMSAINGWEVKAIIDMKERLASENI